MKHLLKVNMTSNVRFSAKLCEAVAVSQNVWAWDNHFMTSNVSFSAKLCEAVLIWFLGPNDASSATTNHWATRFLSCTKLFSSSSSILLNFKRSTSWWYHSKGYSLMITSTCSNYFEPVLIISTVSNFKYLYQINDTKIWTNLRKSVDPPPPHRYSQIFRLKKN